MGLVTKEDIGIRGSVGPFVFASLDENRRLIEEAGLTVVMCEDVTDNMAMISKRWHDAREKRKAELVALEGEDAFEGLQRFLAAVHTVAEERRLSRFVFVAEKAS